MEYRWNVTMEVWMDEMWAMVQKEVSAPSRWGAARAVDSDVAAVADTYQRYTVAVTPVGVFETETFAFLHVESGQMVVGATQLSAQCVAWLQDSGYVLDRKDRTLSRDWSPVVEREWLWTGGTVQVMLNDELLCWYRYEPGLHSTRPATLTTALDGQERLTELVQEIAAGAPRSRFGKIAFIAQRHATEIKEWGRPTPWARADAVMAQAGWGQMKTIGAEALSVAGDDPGQPGDVCEYLGREWTIAERDGSQVLLKDARRRKQARVGLHKVRVLS